MVSLLVGRVMGISSRRGSRPMHTMEEFFDAEFFKSSV
jgi:hypothetical protein